eukprot:GHVN01093729.1.p1 GENE.GHVN01093729.1~~GHVN01093729.1.p1  ORF type:complete len:274 (+),score=-42.56 GHVN01093729.1:1459-2280(+)
MVFIINEKGSDEINIMPKLFMSGSYNIIKLLYIYFNYKKEKINIPFIIQLFNGGIYTNMLCLYTKILMFKSAYSNLDNMNSYISVGSIAFKVFTKKKYNYSNTCKYLIMGLNISLNYNNYLEINQLFDKLNFETKLKIISNNSINYYNTRLILNFKFIIFVLFSFLFNAFKYLNILHEYLFLKFLILNIKKLRTFKLSINKFNPLSWSIEHLIIAILIIILLMLIIFDIIVYLLSPNVKIKEHDTIEYYTTGETIKIIAINIYRYFATNEYKK